MKVLLTGGLGYIGSHVAVELLNRNYEIVIVDNLSNSKIEVVDAIKKITNKEFKFYEIDLRNKEDLRRVFESCKIDAVIHLAGLKAVGESVKVPLKYYDNNISGTITLCEVMEEYNCKNFIFSSSATVYGKPKKLPIKEDFERSTTNPYGTTKLFIEYILEDIYKSDNSYSITLLRYFNPIGSHSSYLIGEDPNGIPNNLMPYIVRVASGEYEELKIYGNDYNTIDGTGVRDYIHVVDLAIWHVKALEKKYNSHSFNVYNVGTGRGYSVLEVVNCFEKVNNVKVKYTITSRRDGDIDACFADTSKAEKELGYKSNKTIEDMCRDAYMYIKNKE